MASSTGSGSTDEDSPTASTDVASHSDLSVCPMEETAARVPCRAFHPLAHPRDGHAASDCALGSDEFPPKPLVGEMAGVDVMGPRIRLRPDDQLLLHHRMVHMTATCPLLSSNPPKLTACYCVDCLHRRFHYDIENKYQLHANCRCSENVDMLTGWRWPVVVMC